jgi:hypothetical protein
MWLVVKPTVGVPLFFAGVALMFWYMLRLFLGSRR